MSTNTPGVLYFVVTGAGPAADVATGIAAAKADGWDVHAIPTAAALEHFVTADALTVATGNPVRAHFRARGDSSLPPAEAVIVAPATYNTINKWAAGIADSYPLSVLAEITGLGATPIAVLPFVNTALAANQVFTDNVARLRTQGVTVLLGPGGFEPHPQRTGGAKISTYPWKTAIRAVNRQW